MEKQEYQTKIITVKFREYDTQEYGLDISGIGVWNKQQYDSNYYFYYSDDFVIDDYISKVEINGVVRTPYFRCLFKEKDIIHIDDIINYITGKNIFDLYACYPTSDKKFFYTDKDNFKNLDLEQFIKQVINYKNKNNYPLGFVGSCGELEYVIPKMHYAEKYYRYNLSYLDMLCE